MLLPIELAEEFKAFLKGCYSKKIVISIPAKSNEYGRFLLGESFFIIRDLTDHPEEPIETIEIHSSDSKKLEKLENEWCNWLQAKFQTDLGKDINSELKPE